MAERKTSAVAKSSLTEDYGAKPVPAGEGKGWFGIGMVYWGSAMCLPSFFIAGLVAGPKTLGSSILVYVVASLVLGGLSILTGMLGAKTRLSSGLTARFTFGSIGAAVLQILMFFALWGWFGVQLGFMVTGFGDGGLMLVLGNSLPAWFWLILGGALITVTAVIGYKAIEKISVVAMPLIIVILLVTIIREYAGGQSFAKAAAVTGPNAMPFGIAVSVLIGSYIIGAMVTPDVTRYAKTRGAAGWGMLFGMTGGFVVVLTLGAIMIKGAGGEFDFSKIMLQGGSVIWAILAVVTIVLASWTTNDVNLYSGALSINALFPKMNKVLITVISGVVGTGLALLGINTAGGFQTFLGFVAIVIPPAVAVMIVDYYLFKGERNQNYDSDKVEKISKFRVIPFVSWMAGTGFGFLVKYTSVKLTSITAVDAIIVAAVVYLVVMLIARSKVKLSA
jgi:cytosine permease